MNLPLFERQVTVFRGKRGVTPVEQLPLRTMLARMQDGTYQPHVEALQAYKGAWGKAAYDEEKGKSCAFTPCCALSTRRAKVEWPDKLISTTGVVYYDIDDVDDPEAVKAQLASDPRVCFAFLSPSARGVKVGVAADGITSPDDYKTVWAALLASFQQTYPAIVFKVDDHVKFLNALCYVSYDPDLYMNPTATPFVMPTPTPTRPRKPRPLPPPGTDASDEARAQEALRHVPADDYEIWLAVGMALHSTSWPMARSLWDTWSATSQKYDEKTQDSKWRGFVEEGGRTIATMFDLAKKYGYRPPKKEKATYKAPVYPAAVSMMGQEAAPDDAPAPDDNEPPQESEGPRPSQATRLVELVLDAGTVLFHTPDGEAYGSLPRDGHTETYPLKVRSFRRWMARLYYDKEGKSPGSQAVQDALAVLEGKAQFDGEELQVYVRLAEHDGKFYLDLGNKAWQSVEVTTEGWTVVSTCPVKFRRMPGMLPLPVPVKGGTLGQLRKLLNLNQPEQDNAWRLVVHWLLANLSPRGPFPILVLHGGHGSGKTTLVRVLRSCTDPNTAPLRRPPKDDQNVAIAASNSWVVAYDNLSHLPDWLSDVLCCVATGLGFATRSLYTDGEEALFQAMRPVVVNGIEELASRADFLDRSIIVHLPAMQSVQDEQTFWAAVDTARPQILGALLNIVSAGLEALPNITLTNAPRMADFARWSCACAAACGWKAAEFLTAYKDVRESTHMLTLEASLLWPPLQKLMEDQKKGESWTGNATLLLASLATRVDEETRRNKGWPKKPNVLSNDLRRLVPTLKAVGMTVTMTRDREGSHIKILEWVGKTSSPSSPSSPASNDVPF